MAGPEVPFNAVARRFSMGSDVCILEDRHLWIHDKDTVVRPGLEDVAGVASFYHPPIAGKNAALTAKIGGRTIPVNDYEWLPGEFVRRGGAEGLDVESRLTVLSGGGWVMSLEIANRSADTRSADVRWLFDPAFGVLSSGRWGWVPPEAAQPVSRSEVGGAVVWELDESNGSWAAAFSTSLGPTGGVIELAPGQVVTVAAAFAVGMPAVVADKVGELVASWESIRSAARERVTERLESFFGAFPRVRSSNEDLTAFYERGVLTFETCLWESDAFILNPHMAESGIDGGAICNYFWGIAYIAKILAICRPELLRSHIVQSLKSDPFEHYAYTPIDGASVGPWYSYNQFSLVWCIYQYAQWTRDFAFLQSEVAGRTVFEWARENALFKDDLAAPVKLIDYGDDHNLLELKRTEAYRHHVPSPNAERCWMYGAVDQMAEWLGLPNPGLSPRAEELAALIHEQLWREDLGWYGTLDAEGRPQVCWSIQIFDMLRFGVVPPGAATRLAEHLNENEFLSTCGIHSLAKGDPGYDERDVDWGGPGVYAGDGPEAVEDLGLAGLTDQADDLLRRLLWWGRRLPYYPQAIRADAEDYRRDGRANVVAGLKASETTVFSLTGMRRLRDGALEFRPHLPKFLDDFEVRGICVGGRSYSVEVSRAGFRILKDGANVGEGPLGSAWRSDGH